jgi:hypothetical protein
VAHVESTEEVVVTVAVSTPNDVLVKQTSADSVLQPSSGPSVGFGSYVGKLSGPIVTDGQGGSVPLMLTEMESDGGKVIPGGGPGGRTPVGRLNSQPPMLISPNRMHKSKNQRLQGISVPPSVAFADNVSENFRQEKLRVDGNLGSKTDPASYYYC